MSSDHVSKVAAVGRCPLREVHYSMYKVRAIFKNIIPIIVSLLKS